MSATYHIKNVTDAYRVLVKIDSSVEQKIGNPLSNILSVDCIWTKEVIVQKINEFENFI